MAGKKRVVKIQLPTKETVGRNESEARELKLRKDIKKQRETFASKGQLKYIRKREREMGKAADPAERAADEATATQLQEMIGGPKRKQIIRGIERTRARAVKLSDERKKRKIKLRKKSGATR